MTTRVVTNGELTVVDMHLAGKQRFIGVTREAIEDFLALTPDEAARMSDDERCAVVRANIGLVTDVALSKLDVARGFGKALVVRSGELGTKE